MRAIAVVLALLVGCGDPTLPLGADQLPAPPEPPDLPPAQPLPPEPVELPSGPRGIYLVESHGSNLRLLATGERPAWSPDGQRIAFQHDSAIHVIGVDGTGETVLGKGVEPAWAPDGTRIAFASPDGIAVMNDEGANLMTLLRHDFRDDTYEPWDIGVGKPAWSPAGDRIAFEHRGDGDLTPAQIFLMNADGSNARRLTPRQGIQYAESDPAWSPDGSEIAYWSYGSGITAASPDDGALQTIYLNFPAVAYGAKPAWSPDGALLLITANRYSDATSPSVWAVRREGGSVETVIREAADAVWSPDGATIAFVRIEGAYPP